MRFLPVSLYKISGHSMEPTIKDDGWVLVWQWGVFPKVGDVMVFKKEKEHWVKRIKSIKGRELMLIGDNPEDSLDSRKLGAVSLDKIIGKVVLSW